MGQCVFCNQPAGFLRKQHSACRDRHESGKREIVALVSEIGTPERDLARLETQVGEIAAGCFVDDFMLRDLVVRGWESAVDVAFEDHVISEEEERLLAELKRHFGLSDEVVDRNGALSRTRKGKVIRELLEGDFPDQFATAGPLPFNLQKTEQLAWVFEDVKYHEHKKRTEYVGGSRGVSFRVAKGVYYRTGAFKGRRVETMEQVHVDSGLLGMTSKHLYFVGVHKRFRIRFDKIISFEPLEDGISVQRDAMTATPQTFITGDGWFTYNLVANLAQM